MKVGKTERKGFGHKQDGELLRGLDAGKRFILSDQSFLVCYKGVQPQACCLLSIAYIQEFFWDQFKTQSNMGRLQV